jgi:hypothetical protein
MTAWEPGQEPWRVIRREHPGGGLVAFSQQRSISAAVISLSCSEDIPASRFH